MQLVSVSKSRSPQKVWLKFDNGRLLPFSIDDLVVYKLEKFTDLDPQTFALIETSSARFLLREYSLRQIAISPKTRVLLTRKLNQYSGLISKKYGYSKSLVLDLVPGLVSYFSDQDLLNPHDYVDYLRHRFPSRSTVDLNYRLRQAGVDLKIEPRPDEEIAAIRKLLDSRYLSRNLFDFKSRNSVISSLYRKGFALNHIKKAIDETLRVR